jgi:hypothetical protein
MPPSHFLYSRTRTKSISVHRSKRSSLFLARRMQQFRHQLVTSYKSVALPSALGISQGVEQTAMDAALSSGSAIWLKKNPVPCHVEHCNAM